MKKFLLLLAAACSVIPLQGFAQNGPQGGPRQMPPGFAEFCSSHAQECAELKQLHENARAACQDRESSGCKAAHEQVRAKMQAMEAEGLPVPPGDGHHGPHGGQE